MSNNSTGSPLSLVSAVLSVLGALLLLSVVTGAWNYTLAGNMFLIGLVSGAAGAGLGWHARKSGANPMNTLGLRLGLAVVVACLLLIAYNMAMGTSIAGEEA